MAKGAIAIQTESGIDEDPIVKTDLFTGKKPPVEHFATRLIRNNTSGFPKIFGSRNKGFSVSNKCGRFLTEALRSKREIGGNPPFSRIANGSPIFQRNRLKVAIETNQVAVIKPRQRVGICRVTSPLLVGPAIDTAGNLRTEELRRLIGSGSGYGKPIYPLLNPRQQEHIERLIERAGSCEEQRIAHFKGGERIGNGGAAAEPGEV